MTADTHKCVRFFVSGRVQGVFFRAATREQAQLLGLAGYARNLDDGRVEVYVRGPNDRVDALARWLWRGPPNAEVSAVETAATASVSDGHPEPGNFEIR